MATLLTPDGKKLSGATAKPYLTPEQAAAYLEMNFGTFKAYRQQNKIEPDAIVVTGKRGRPTHAYKRSTLKQWNESRVAA